LEFLSRLRNRTGLGGNVLLSFGNSLYVVDGESVTIIIFIRD
jgi:hypothetical protein